MVICLNAYGSHVERADLSGDPPACEDRDWLSILQTDPSAVEKRRCSTTAAAPATTTSETAPTSIPTSPEVEDSSAFKKELPLLRKEETEPGQVDLLLVHLDLCEIRVEGEIRRQVLGDSVLDVQPRIHVDVVGDHRIDAHVCLEP